MYYFMYYLIYYLIYYFFICAFQKIKALKLNETQVMEGYSFGESVFRDRAKDISRSGKDTSTSKADPSGSATASTSAATAANIKHDLKLLPGGDLPGYMPLREDFDIEYENNAEEILADMEFVDNLENASERELQLEVIRIYNMKLKERNERKKFVVERGVVDFRKQQTQERKMSKVFILLCYILFCSILLYFTLFYSNLLYFTLFYSILL